MMNTEFIRTLYEKKLAELENHPKPAGWLYTTVRYMMMTENRKRKENQAFCSLSGVEDQICDTRAESQLATVESDGIWSVLSEREYGIPDLLYNQGYKGKEAAEKLGVKESTLRVQVLRIRRKL